MTIQCAWRLHLENELIDFLTEIKKTKIELIELLFIDQIHD